MFLKVQVTESFRDVVSPCTQCGADRSHQLSRSYLGLKFLGFIPARYANLEYQQRCLGCGKMSIIPAPAGMPPLPAMYRFGWIVVMVLVIGGVALYFQRMGACSHRKTDPKVARALSNTDRHYANVALVKPLVDKIDAATMRCIDAVDELQKGMLPSVLTMPKQAPANTGALRGAVVYPHMRDGEGLFPRGPLFSVKPGGPCGIDVSPEFDLYSAGRHPDILVDVSAEVAKVTALVTQTTIPPVVVITAWQCKATCNASAAWISTADKKVLAVARAMVKPLSATMSEGPKREMLEKALLAEVAQWK